MYIIEDGKAYLVDGEVAYLATFDTTGKLIVDKEKTIETEGKPVYTYTEMYAKLNVAYMIEEANNKNALKGVENKEIDKLNNVISELMKENDALKAELSSLKTTEEEKEEAPIEEEVVEEEKEEKSSKKNK